MSYTIESPSTGRTEQADTMAKAREIGQAMADRTNRQALIYGENLSGLPIHSCEPASWTA